MSGARAITASSKSDRRCEISATSESGPCSPCALRSNAISFGIGRRVGDDHQFARTGHGIDPDPADELALGLLHP